MIEFESRTLAFERRRYGRISLTQLGFLFYF